METRKTISPGTIEGGDIIHLPNHLICGITQRTNVEGVDQLQKWLNVTVGKYHDPNIVHLKSYVTYLGDNYFIATESHMNHPTLKNFKILLVDDNERYAANTLTIERTVLIPKGFPRL